MNMKEEDKNNFLMKDMLLIYRNKYNLSLKIEYDCFDKKYMDNNSKILSDTIYKSYQIPKDYFGIIVSFKKDIEKNSFYYEHAGINKGKIRLYKYEIYELNEKEKLFNEIYDDINEALINKFNIKDNNEDIKYKSFYRKENYGKIIIDHDFNEVIFKSDKRAINIQNFIRTILNYEGFLIRVQIIKSNN
ncbi:hypothetical protein [Clostridium tetani]|uniref:Uncharacterized protein n=1 Tax=Clostridium tetani TaxID=1513 RepID=A0ABY0EXA9_CLOTA|nr:hypothetical protein [Clostridium tetani]KHO40525.1 hypothetical protein OR62_00125 [Clostridium tetani]RXI59206.1 hypothetical protein DP131_00200 [Clostridium tetani]RXI71301.1 hypothetical protein DQN76_05455 [Clostridium tetani]CDI48109.1 hypothetical protein BN906_00033 [Clostridium tetani 12124569]